MRFTSNLERPVWNNIRKSSQIVNVARSLQRSLGDMYGLLLSSKPQVSMQPDPALVSAETDGQSTVGPKPHIKVGDQAGDLGVMLSPPLFNLFPGPNRLLYSQVCLSWRKYWAWSLAASPSLSCQPRSPGGVSSTRPPSKMPRRISN